MSGDRPVARLVEVRAAAILADVLDDPATWSEPRPDGRAQLLAAAAAERHDSDSDSESDSESEVDGGPDHDGHDDGHDPHGERPSPVVDLERQRTRSAGRGRSRLAVAAAVLVIAATSAAVGLAWLRPGASPETLTVALAPVGSPSGPSATARIEERPNGARLVLDVVGLGPAPEGAFYEVWLVGPGPPPAAVSAGTFHMRGSDRATIELWSGVSPREHPIITVTLESAAHPDADGVVVLMGEVVAGD